MVSNERQTGYTATAHVARMGQVSVTVDSRGAGKFIVRIGENSRELSRSEAIGAWIKAQDGTTTQTELLRRFVIFQAAADARRTTADNR